MSYRDEVYFESQPEPEVPFSRKEYQQRLTRVRERMAKAGIDCLFLTSPESMYYICGYMSLWYQAESPKEWPPTSGVAVHVDHDRIIHFNTEREAVLTRIFNVSDDTRFFPRDSYRDGTLFIRDELKAEGWIKGIVGLEHWAHRPNRAISQRFEDRFTEAGARVVDGSDVVREVRWVKSPAELECLEEASRIADVGMAAAREILSPGVTELEVYGEIVRAMSAAGGEAPGFTMAVLSGMKSNAPHALATRKKISAGEIVLVDVCGVYNRYHINTARTFALGEQPADTLEVARKAAGSIEVLRDLIRPNVPVRDVTRALMDYYIDQGIWESRGWIGGYEMGIAFPPDWVGNFVFDPLSEKNADRVFEPGTAVNCESQFFLPRHIGLFMMVESIVFREDEAKLMSTVPYGLTIIE